MKASEYASRVKNMKYHNLCTHLDPPAGVGDILGLSLPFCLQSSRPNQDVSKTMSRLRRSVRLKAFFSNKEAEEEDNNYIPKLHVPSKWLPPQCLKRCWKEIRCIWREIEQIKRLEYLPKALLQSIPTAVGPFETTQRRWHIYGYFYWQESWARYHRKSYLHKTRLVWSSWRWRDLPPYRTKKRTLHWLRLNIKFSLLQWN